MAREPLEIYPDQHWEILDPNTAQMVAIFFDEDRAYEYLNHVNGVPSPFKPSRPGVEELKQELRGLGQDLREFFRELRR